MKIYDGIWMWNVVNESIWKCMRLYDGIWMDMKAYECLLANMMVY